MKNLLILLCFISFSAHAAYIDATTLGVTAGTDISVSFTNAIDTAVKYGKDLYLPSGNYYANTVGGDGDIINLPLGYTSPVSIRIFGDANTYIYSSANSGNLLAMVYGAYNNVTIDRINFINTHTLSSTGPTCILAVGNSPYFITNLSITNCTFRGFNTSLTLQGINGGKIKDNRFGSPRGRDNATNTPTPAVFIWLMDNSVANINKNIEIEDNYANGLDSAVSVTSLVSKAPFDGFAYGEVSGLIVTHNIVENCVQEAIFVQPSLNIPGDYPVIITGNMINGAIPDGTIDIGSGTPLLESTAIRCEANNVNIDGNIITNATIGIFQYGSTYGNVRLKTWNVNNNTIIMYSNRNYHPQYGIYMQGASSATKGNFGNIGNNTIIADSINADKFVGVTVNFMSGVNVKLNHVIVNNSSLNSAIGISLYQDDVIASVGNFTKGCVLSLKVTGVTSLTQSFNQTY